MLPCGRDEASTLSDERNGKALTFEAVVSKPGLVRNPFLVHVVVEAGEHAHDLDAARVDADIGTDSVVNVNSLSPLELPGARGHLIGFASKGTDGAEINNIARHLRGDSLFNVGADLHVVPTT
ncbi:hypothetical protein BC937DRAFT_90796 [Endogone sp. FLAS-F59071]|nr:hypothetical protein BC937DRAFT_90796 [Endogone sp. FLAS-F59071]|eukprot:RUS16804.1 hypothetical protein BC937DRAFT_90796 [Endogone sp. FLAS-F59071]